MAVNLTGVRQQEYLTEKRGGRPPSNPARLTAIRSLGRKDRVGIVWLTQCDCGNEREVPAQYFTSGRIKKCEICADPKLADRPALMVKRREEIREEIRREEDKGWYPEPFRSTWRDVLGGFNELQMLLFETVMDERPRQPEMMMQATDIVNRVPLNEIDIEFLTFEKDRIRRARERLKK